ncbi:MAG: hypothetical protein HY783_04930 [Chloroflexi bacterium]|nr:hypothetical protein [Chloroflexota bacterium]
MFKTIVSLKFVLIFVALSALFALLAHSQSTAECPYFPKDVYATCNGKFFETLLRTMDEQPLYRERVTGTTIRYVDLPFTENPKLIKLVNIDNHPWLLMRKLDGTVNSKPLKGVSYEKRVNLSNSQWNSCLSKLNVDDLSGLPLTDTTNDPYSVDSSMLFLEISRPNSYHFLIRFGDSRIRTLFSALEREHFASCP